ncbi:MAG: HEAT repeat domain-containing protein [Desulfomonilaceae bacterium]
MKINPMKIVACKAFCGLIILVAAIAMAQSNTDKSQPGTTPSDIPSCAKSLKQLKDSGASVKDILPVLLKDLANPSEVTRLEAVEALSELGTVAISAIPDLVNLLHDKDALVRETTALALDSEPAGLQLPPVVVS